MSCSFNARILWRVDLGELVFVCVLHEVLVHQLVTVNLSFTLHIKNYVGRTWLTHHFNFELASVRQLSSNFIVYNLLSIRGIIIHWHEFSLLTFSFVKFWVSNQHRLGQNIRLFGINHGWVRLIDACMASVVLLRVILIDQWNITSRLPNLLLLTLDLFIWWHVAYNRALLHLSIVRGVVKTLLCRLSYWSCDLALQLLILDNIVLRLLWVVKCLFWIFVRAFLVEWGVVATVGGRFAYWIHFSHLNHWSFDLRWSHSPSRRLRRLFW